MLKYLPILLSLFFVSCDVFDSTKIKDDTDKSSNVHDTKLVKYSDINLTTSQRISDLYFPGFEFSGEDVRHKYHILENCQDIINHICDTKFIFSPTESIIFDYNQDGKLDLFAFLTNTSQRNYHSPNVWISGPGKFMLIDDYLGEEKKTIVDSEYVLGVRFYINDYNEDGVLDLLVVNVDGHEGTPDAWYNKYSNIGIIYFNRDGTFTINEIPYETFHDYGIETGDIDNDGDIDIVLSEARFNTLIDSQGENTIIFFINDGYGNFNIEYRIKETKIFKDLGLPLRATTLELFDLNNDGCLDLFFGFSPKQPSISEDPNVPFDLNVLRIMWGNCKGEYSFENSTYLPIYNKKFETEWGGEYVNPKDVNFFDIDNDGDYDILVNHTLGWTGVVFEMFRNDGDNTFISITDQVFLKNEFYVPGNIFGELTPTQIPFFECVTIYDMDGDDDYDIVPRKIVGTGFHYPISIWHTGLEFFQNENGIFNFSQLK